MDRAFYILTPSLLSSMLLAACGGGGGSTQSAPPVSGDPTAAAKATATQNEMCVAIQPFYWEIGDKGGVPLASGSVGFGAPVRTDRIEIASASKWIYSTYFVQRAGGMDSLDMVLDVPFLNFTSGYTWSPSSGPGSCSRSTTVADCVADNSGKPLPVESNVGVFNYNGGHMEVHANSRAGLGPDDNEALSNAVLTPVTGVGFSNVDNLYTQPLLAGGVGTSSANYAAMLAGILSGRLKMHDVLVDDERPLGTARFKVATTGGTTSSPLADAPNADGVTEAWNYSLGHWVEDDPTYGDHAVSSTGALGFYPWIDRTLTYYGIVARMALPGPETFEGFQSAQCGRLIRQAWVTGVTVTSKVPTPHTR